MNDDGIVVCELGGAETVQMAMGAVKHRAAAHVNISRRVAGPNLSTSTSIQVDKVSRVHDRARLTLRGLRSAQMLVVIMHATITSTVQHGVI